MTDIYPPLKALYRVQFRNGGESLLFDVPARDPFHAVDKTRGWAHEGKWKDATVETVECLHEWFYDD